MSKGPGATSCWPLRRGFLTSAGCGTYWRSDRDRRRRRAGISRAFASPSPPHAGWRLDLGWPAIGVSPFAGAGLWALRCGHQQHRCHVRTSCSCRYQHHGRREPVMCSLDNLPAVPSRGRTLSVWGIRTDLIAALCNGTALPPRQPRGKRRRRISQARFGHPKTRALLRYICAADAAPPATSRNDPCMTPQTMRRSCCRFHP